MYTDRYTTSHGLNPGGVAFALGVSGVLLFGLSLTAPNFIAKFEKPFIGTNIPIEKAPPPKPEPRPKADPLKKVATQPIDHIDVTPPIVTTVSGGLIAPHIDEPPPTTVIAGTGGDIGTVVIPPHVPVLLEPQLDSRYIDSFQPNYPSDERLAGHEGRVVVRVLIGADGRVKDVQQVSAATTAFFEATRKQALAKWRFKPGTRDGVAVEAWRTMAVRFVLDE